MMIEVLFQDEFLVAVQKPSGVLVHRSPESQDRRFVLQTLRDQLGGQWLYPVHRLDRAASGVLLFARSSLAAQKLQAQLGQPTSLKQYFALVRGGCPTHWRIDRPFKDKRNHSAIPASTDFCRLAEIHLAAGPTVSLVSALLHSGRRHQIRRHLSSTSNQIIGDTTYGKGRINRLFRKQLELPRMFLHAERLHIDHPFCQCRLKLRAPLPEDLVACLRKLAQESDWSPGPKKRDRYGFHDQL